MAYNRLSVLCWRHSASDRGCAQARPFPLHPSCDNASASRQGHQRSQGRRTLV